MKKNLLPLILLFISLSVFAEQRLEGEFIVDPQQALFVGTLNDPFQEGPASDGQEVQDVIDESAALMLEAARWTFSGMIYGFEFTYTPQDSARGVSEAFSWDPVAMIPYGDPALEVVSVDRLDNGLLVIRLSYTLSGDQVLRYESWKSTVYIHVMGLGGASLYEDGSIKNAIGNSLKEGIRAYLRTVEYNKPRQVTGLVGLTAVPVFGYRAGECTARSRIAVRLDNIRSYQLD